MDGAKIVGLARQLAELTENIRELEDAICDKAGFSYVDGFNACFVDGCQERDGQLYADLGDGRGMRCVSFCGDLGFFIGLPDDLDNPQSIAYFRTTTPGRFVEIVCEG